MPMMKIESADHPSSADGPFQIDNPNTPWFVAGVAYTDNPAFIAYFQRHTYAVTEAEEGQPDADHLAAVAKLKDQALRTSTHTSVGADGADAGRRNYFL